MTAKYGTIVLNQHVSAEEFAFEAFAFAIGYPARAFTTSANVTVTAIDDDEVPCQRLLSYGKWPLVSVSTRDA